MHGDERILFGQSGFSALWNKGRKTTLTEQDDRRMQKILPAVRRDTQEIQAWLNYLNGCNERMQQVGLKRRVTEFTSVVDNTWRWTNLVWSVLGQPLNGILWRCIPSRTPVSSGLRTTKTFPTYANEKIFATKHHTYSSWSTDVILAIRRDTQEILRMDVASWLAMMPRGRKGADILSCCDKKNQLSERSRPRPPCPKTYLRSGKAVEVLIFWSRSGSFGNANRTRHVPENPKTSN